MNLRKIVRCVFATLGIFLALLILMFALLASVGHPKYSTDNFLIRPAGPPVFKFTDVPRDPEPSDAEIEQYVDRLLAEMSLTEKVHQMSGDTWLWNLVVFLTVEEMKYNDRPIRAGHNPRLGIPPIGFSDGPRGVVMEYSTCFPVTIARGASWDRQLEARVGDIFGKEIRALGGNFSGAVCINLLRHPAWGRAQETYGEDPCLLGEMAASLIPSIQQHNVMACAKHFALNNIEESRFRVDVRLDERALREVYLPHFKQAVDAGVASVMSAYNKVRGEYCGENSYLLRRVLKDEWGFRGFVISDFVYGLYDGPKGARAGLDVEMPVSLQYGEKLVQAVEKGEVPQEAIDDAVRRILRRKLFYATRKDRQTYDRSMVASAEHVALSREVAERSVVLLKNDGGVLPLDKRTVRKLAVLGRLADTENIGDRGSSRVYPPYIVTPLGGLRRYLGSSTQILYEAGTDLDRARAAARSADAVVVFAGRDFGDEGEYIPQKAEGERGGDVKSFRLRPAEQDLVKAASSENRRCAVVLMGGSAFISEEWRHEVPAILMAWYPGMEGGTALARILFGEVNPSAKLPITSPKDASQLPPFDNRADTVEYGYYHGYTLCDKQGYEPAFPFGYGLSYTSFHYANLKLSPARIGADGTLDVTVEVTNAGSRPGEEIVQLYVGFPESAVDRPVKVLRGFEKVAVAPGETRIVRIPVTAASLAYYDPAVSQWRVERRTHRVYVGSSSRAADLLTATFQVTDDAQ